jgi:transposase
MMGSNDKPQSELFCAFNLDEVVPRDHLLRQIDQFLDFSDLRDHLAPYYSHTGRPSVDPELMIRMLLIGNCLGIRSERQLCEEVNLNLAYRWFCKLSIATRSRITRPSRRTAMAGSAKPKPSAMCSSRF